MVWRLKQTVPGYSVVLWGGLGYWMVLTDYWDIIRRDGLKRWKKTSASLANDREKRTLRENLREHIVSENFLRLSSYLLLLK